ncbi:dTDP-4-dehydrorhamnose reductase [Salinivibrio sp. PR932]|uniref:dTDP-4-dehydrorhamnose reductase n=1 Tax=Salinivibrio sp. PR932 TaxID=1909492 RepID=UPI0009891F3F|nr:dTDP-4-dehydrorhamnose reductase [Salinivibrio sp. PR932]OOF13750.1 dTDP-4-dehydrorhamnose reductase [Salinivibrio sp. PR932]
MKILITGGSGQVGFELQRVLSVFGECIAPTPDQLDLADQQAVSTYLESLKPSMIVNAAAYTAVDKAESEPELAERLNAKLPEQLASYCAKHDIWLIHYSTDYVYDGSGEEARPEDHPTAPLSIYGASKLRGDQAIARSGTAYYIFRTSWVYGARGNNFVKTMLRLGREKASLNIVNDQIGAPTSARLIAQVTAQALAQRANDKVGVYHLTTSGSCSWQQFAQEIFTQAEQLKIPLSITPGAVEGIPTSSYPTPAQRPLNSRLKLEKIEKAFQLTLPDWKSQLRLVMAEIRECQG